MGLTMVFLYPLVIKHGNGQSTPSSSSSDEFDVFFKLGHLWSLENYPLVI